VVVIDPNRSLSEYFPVINSGRAFLTHIPCGQAIELGDSLITVLDQLHAVTAHQCPSMDADTQILPGQVTS
jgi:hypothetical protein